MLYKYLLAYDSLQVVYKHHNVMCDRKIHVPFTVIYTMLTGHAKHASTVFHTVIVGNGLLALVTII